MPWTKRCSRCGDDLKADRDGRSCEDCERELEHRARTEGVHCPKCDGRGEFIDCFDDLCQMNGECFHSGNTVCELCDGAGRVSPETREEYYDGRLAERAQLSPLGTIVLLGAVATLFIVALAIANGVTLG